MLRAIQARIRARAGIMCTMSAGDSSALHGKIDRDSFRAWQEPLASGGREVITYPTCERLSISSHLSSLGGGREGSALRDTTWHGTSSQSYSPALFVQRTAIWAGVAQKYQE